VWALPRLYRFSPGFSLINWTILFFLINRKGKTFISFKKNSNSSQAWLGVISLLPRHIREDESMEE
jgi:hypothetical protein